MYFSNEILFALTIDFNQNPRKLKLKIFIYRFFLEEQIFL
jgi:hypothetical protein